MISELPPVVASGNNCLDALRQAVDTQAGDGGLEIGAAVREALASNLPLFREALAAQINAEVEAGVSAGRTSLEPEITREDVVKLFLEKLMLLKSSGSFENFPVSAQHPSIVSAAEDALSVASRPAFAAELAAEAKPGEIPPPRPIHDLPSHANYQPPKQEDAATAVNDAVQEIKARRGCSFSDAWTEARRTHSHLFAAWDAAIELGKSRSTLPGELDEFGEIPPPPMIHCPGGWEQKHFDDERRNRLEAAKRK